MRHCTTEVSEEREEGENKQGREAKREDGCMWGWGCGGASCT